MSRKVKKRVKEEFQTEGVYKDLKVNIIQGKQ